jgi:hypothetical protein
LERIERPELVNFELFDTFQIRISGAIIHLHWDEDQYCFVDGAEPAVVFAVDHYLRTEDPAPNVKTFHYRWRVACRVAKQFSGTVVEEDRVIVALREGWMRLLKSNLLPGWRGRSNEFYCPEGLAIHIATRGATRRTNYDGFRTFDLGNRKCLLAARNSPEYRSVRVPWDRLTEISFHYTTPPTDVMLEVQKSVARPREISKSTGALDGKLAPKGE